MTPIPVGWPGAGWQIHDQHQGMEQGFICNRADNKLDEHEEEETPLVPQ